MHHNSLRIIFLLLLLKCGGNIIACGPFYPQGDDIRFILFNPDNFGCSSYADLYYSAHSFYAPDERNIELNAEGVAKSIYQPNIAWWSTRCADVPVQSDIYEALYINDSSIYNKNSVNTFVKYLYSHADKEAIDYLKFAYICNSLNAYNSDAYDPWEKQTEEAGMVRVRQINAALQNSKRAKDKDIQQRYAFLGIRMAYYNSDSAEVTAIYKKYFVGRKQKNIVDYWALYFYAQTRTDAAEVNYLLAQVFEHAPDKRFVCYQLYDGSMPIGKTLQYAKTGAERSAVWLLDGVHKPGKALDNIRNMYEANGTSAGLDFLYCREINKLEDWIFTPYYSQFSPSLEEYSYWDEGASDTAINRHRIQNDRAYAEDVLQFAQEVMKNKNSNGALWEISGAYLQFMTGNNKALASIEAAQIKQGNTAAQWEQAEILHALIATAMQVDANAGILPFTKEILLRQGMLNNNRFLFALGRELEYKGNTTDAALLYSKMNRTYDWENHVSWKTPVKHRTLYFDYYDDYFFYMDALYTPQQMKDLLHRTENADPQSDFEKWLYSDVKHDAPRFYDLLGTKYIRLNELTAALNSFEKVNDTVWQSDVYYYKDYLDANPFYTNLYNEHTRTSADTIRYDKESITRELLNYLKKADEGEAAQRAYNYFQVANCYFNMTQYGNSWMMRRYYWTGTAQPTKLSDDTEYFTCALAKKYYLKAKETAQNKKFAALCLRMAGKCEKYRIYREIETGPDRYNYSLNTDDSVFDANVYYAQIKKEYPEYYKDLISNCYVFEEYLKEGRSN